MLLSPPLVITAGEVDEIVEKAKRAFDATAERPGMRCGGMLDRDAPLACGAHPAALMSNGGTTLA